MINVCDSSLSAGGLQSFEIYCVDNIEIKKRLLKHQWIKSLLHTHHYF